MHSHTLQECARRGLRQFSGRTARWASASAAAAEPVITRSLRVWPRGLVVTPHGSVFGEDGSPSAAPPHPTGVCFGGSGGDGSGLHVLATALRRTCIRGLSVRDGGRSGGGSNHGGSDFVLPWLRPGTWSSSYALVTALRRACTAARLFGRGRQSFCGTAPPDGRVLRWRRRHRSSRVRRVFGRVYG